MLATTTTSPKGALPPPHGLPALRSKEGILPPAQSTLPPGSLFVPRRQGEYHYGSHQLGGSSGAGSDGGGAGAADGRRRGHGEGFRRNAGPRPIREVRGTRDGGSHHHSRQRARPTTNWAYQACTQPSRPPSIRPNGARRLVARAMGSLCSGSCPARDGTPGGFLNVRVNGEDLEHYLAEFAVYPEAGALLDDLPRAGRGGAADLQAPGGRTTSSYCDVSWSRSGRSAQSRSSCWPIRRVSPAPRERRLLTPPGRLDQQRGRRTPKRGKPVELDAGRNSWADAL